MAYHQHRSGGRSLDISGWLGASRLIVIGYLYDAPTPLPLRADGRALPTRGLVMVRWSTPLQ